MGLINNVGVPNTNPAAISPDTTATKGKSKGGEYQKKVKKELYEAALLIQGALKRGNVTLSPEEQKAIDRLTRVPGSGHVGGAAEGFGRTPLLNQLFGATPTVGQTLALNSDIIVNKMQESKNFSLGKFIADSAKHGTIIVLDKTTKALKIEKLAQ